jgi:hypothetical protein
MRWGLFAVASVVWIAACWFFAGMIAVSEGTPHGSIARQQCAQGISRGGSDYRAAYDSPPCVEAGRAAAEAVYAPIEKKGLLWGVLPVVALGGIMVMRRRG